MKRKPSLLIIFLTVFIDLIGFGIVLPLLPQYSERFGAHGFEIGMIISSFSVMQFLFAPFWGRLSDRIGRRPVLLISNFGSAVSYALFGAASFLTGTRGLVLLIASRVFAGICGANLSVASAYIADITPPEKRSKSMGLIGMAFGLGFILGPAIGGFSGDRLGLAAPGLVAGVLCFANFLLGCVILGESRSPGSEPVTHRPKLAQWSHTFSQPKLGVLIGLYFLATFCFTCFEATLPLLLGSAQVHPDDLPRPAALVEKIHASADPFSVELRKQISSSEMAGLAPSRQAEALSEALNQVIAGTPLSDLIHPIPFTPRAKTSKLLESKKEKGDSAMANRMLLEDAYPELIRRKSFYFARAQVGYLFAFCGLVAAFTQGGLIGWLLKIFGDQRLIAISLAAVGISLALIPGAASLGALLGVLAFFAAASNINRAPTMGQISLHSAKNEIGATMGVAQSAATIARIVGPTFATTLFYLHREWPYWITAGVALVTSFLAWVALCRSPKIAEGAAAPANQG